MYGMSEVTPSRHAGPVSRPRFGEAPPSSLKFRRQNPRRRREKLTDNYAQHMQISSSTALLKEAPAAHLVDPREASYAAPHPRPAPRARARTGGRVWTIGGGKGGIGKSLFTANVGITLAQMGNRVCVIDADLGGANLHSCLGVTQPMATLDDFMTRQSKGFRSWPSRPRFRI